MTTEINNLNNGIVSTSNVEQLHNKVCEYIDNARKSIQRSIDTEMVKAYWFIGRDIVEEEQKGQERAEYGSYLLNALSKKLTEKYSRGFSVTTLRDIRQFYLVYHDYELIHHAVRGELVNDQIRYAVRTQSVGEPIHHALRGGSITQFSPKLGWIHYRALMRVTRAEARRFYEIEAEKNNWSGRELERQINSLLFDRLAKSKDKAGLIKLANKGHELHRPEDAIKDPMILEFLDIPESNRLAESKLEEALISNIQHFLLELGNGFAFVARQKRLTLDGDHFYADLIFYHVILKCYIIIDIKTKKLSHTNFVAQIIKE
jgi:predicted nuclease of restriction endonuclease-like (RecB) superfamily